MGHRKSGKGLCMGAVQARSGLVPGAYHVTNQLTCGVGIGWSIAKDDIVMGHKWTLKLASSGPLKVVTVYSVTRKVRAKHRKNEAVSGHARVRCHLRRAVVHQLVRKVGRVRRIVLWSHGIWPHVALPMRGAWCDAWLRVI